MTAVHSLLRRGNRALSTVETVEDKDANMPLEMGSGVWSLSVETVLIVEGRIRWCFVEVF